MRLKEIVILGALFALSAAAVHALTWRPPAQAKGTLTPPPAESPPPPETGEAFVALFAGDLALGENFGPHDESNVLKAQGYAHPFHMMRPILKASDLVLATLETPIISPPPEDQAKKEPWYWTSAEHAPQALSAANVTAVSLANDHVLDFGPLGLQETIGLLEERNIRHLGAGLDPEAARAPLRVEKALGEHTFKLAVLAANQQRPRPPAIPAAEGDPEATVRQLDVEDLEVQIKELKTAEPDLYVVTYLHWGRDYLWMQDSQQEAARKLIDAGADLVVGSGSHMMQQMERYKGRWILYGLGNFVFTSAGQYQKRRTAVPFSLLARLEVRVKDGKLRPRLKVYPLHTDNLANEYQGHFLDVKTIGDAYWPLLWKAYPYDRKIKRLLDLTQDQFGRHWALAPAGVKMGRAVR